MIALVQSVGDAQVAEAEMLVARDRAKAVKLAEGLMRMPMLSAPHRERAEAVLASPEEAPCLQHRAALAPHQRSRSPDGASAARGEREAPDRGRAAPASHAATTLASCARCRAKRRARKELGLLIETYRAMGNTAQAHKNMALYVQRFPTAHRAETYRIMLERANP